jgi:multiple sugar transport system ATP-binding protein
MGRISYRNVTREYDDGRIVAVDDLSLDVEDGQFLVLLGPRAVEKVRHYGCSPASNR